MHCSSAAITFCQIFVQQVGQFSCECCPLSHEIISGIHHFGKLACCTIPTLSLCAFPDLCLVLVCLSGRLACCPISALNLCCLTCIHSLRGWLLVPPLFSRVGLVFHPHLHCPGDTLHYVPGGVGRGVMCGA
jgi:hypothetical protein